MRSSCEPRLELDRLDAVGHELRMARDGREPKVGRDRGELAQQIEHVGLLTRPVAAEHVGVEDDHASSS